MCYELQTTFDKHMRKRCTFIGQLFCSIENALGAREQVPIIQRTVQELMDAFELFTLTEVHEIVERYTFGSRNQHKGVPFDAYKILLVMPECMHCA